MLTVTCRLLQTRENTAGILTRTLTVTRTVMGLNQQTVTFIIRLLHTINASLHSKLEALGDRVEQLQGDVFVPQKENKKLRKEIVECKQREADMKGLVDEASFNAKLAEQHSDRNEQYSRLWNLKLLFIPEKPGPALETPEKSDEKEALRVFHTHTPQHLDTVHRVGEKAEHSQADHRPFRLKEDQTRGVAETYMLKGSNPSRSSLYGRSDEEQLSALPSSIRTPWNAASMEESSSNRLERFSKSTSWLTSPNCPSTPQPLRRHLLLLFSRRLLNARRTSK